MRSWQAVVARAAPASLLEIREVLPRAHRMVDPADFRTVIRTGSRAGNERVVVHCRTDEDSEQRLVGFVVPKSEIKRANGRNRVKRQLRHLMRERIAALPQGSRIVIRARATALGMTSDDLARDLDGALGRAWKKWERKEGKAS